MMGLKALRKYKIGILLLPGYNPASIIEVDAIFRLTPNCSVKYIALKPGVATGKGDFNLVPDQTIRDCPALDILIISNASADFQPEKEVLSFIRSQAQKAKYILAIANGVYMLKEAGCLNQEKFTADPLTLKKLAQSNRQIVMNTTRVCDGKFYTSSSSTGAIESAFLIVQKIAGTWLTRFLEFNLEYEAQFSFPAIQTNLLSQLPPMPHCGLASSPLPNCIYRT